jgi:hypothetical protein
MLQKAYADRIGLLDCAITVLKVLLQGAVAASADEEPMFIQRRTGSSGITITGLYVTTERSANG